MTTFSEFALNIFFKGEICYLKILLFKMSNFIKLQTQSILQVPISSYENNFTFIVNGKEFHTSEIVADLLSPKIPKARKNDPTIREF